MGMAASQARLLTITARLSDLELQAQQLSNARIRLAVESGKISEDYVNALSGTKMVTSTSANDSTRLYSDLTANLLTGYNANALANQYALVNKNGNVLVSQSLANQYNAANGDLGSFLSSVGASSGDNDKVDYYTNLFNKMAQDKFIVESNANLSSSAWLENQLNNGGLFLERFSATANGGAGDFESIPWQATSDVVQTDDKSESAIATAKYNAELDKIQSKDKIYELQLKNVDTEHQALQTEYDSVKKVIEKNIERSFKTFG